MTISVYDDNGQIRNYTIDKKSYKNEPIEEVNFIDSTSKESSLLKLIEVLYGDGKAILFDKNNKFIEERLKTLDLKSFQNKDFLFIYFTSGTTGNPVGALKTKDNLLLEIEQLTVLLKKYNIKKVIVTVPFIHVYGTLFGALYPLENDIDIVIKEHFLPNDLLDMIDEYSMVVTTPLYIKSLNKLDRKKDLSKSIFISSTAPLYPEIAKEFNEKFQTDVIQIFGSTETGGIAYKYNDSEFWTPINKVEISQNQKGELKVVSPFISDTLYEEGFKETNNQIQTFDYVEIVENRFKLIGRSSQIIKVAGKRYSTLQIENILENEPNIQKALVYVSSNKEALRGEELNIILQSNENILVKDIKKILKKELLNVRFSINLKIVDEIKTTAVGKKMMIE